LPQSPEQIATTFRVYTRQNSGIFEFENILPENTGNRFSSNRPTVFMVHGFAQSGYSSWVTDMFAALLNRADYNVIVVDWRDGASIGFQPFPASNTRVVGTAIAHMAQALVNDKNMRWSDVQCMGFSLGAHACAFFGQDSSGNVGRITGLDPAGDVFNHDVEGERLSSHDAAFVDIIHTNAYGLIPSGIDRNCGHVDFWANGGRDQPGCLLLGEICDHQRATYYYQATVDGACTFDPRSCSSMNAMQNDNCANCSGSSCSQEVGVTAINQSGRGIYRFDVTGNYPHCP